MSDIAIRTALEAHLLTLTPLLPTAWDNKQLNSTTGAHQIVSFLPADPENPTLSEGLEIKRGLLQILLKYPPDTGSVDAAQRAELIKAHFPPLLVLTSGTIKVRIRGNASIRPGYLSGSHYALPVRIRFETFIQGV